MHLLVTLLCVVVAYAFPAKDDSFPVRFVDFEGEYLSDPRERELVASKLDHLWPIEDYWNWIGIGGVCEHAKEKQDPSVLKWFLKKGLQKACNRGDHALLAQIFEAILEFHDNEIIRVLFPIAKQLMDHCAFAANDLYLSPPTLKDRWQAWMSALDNSGPLPEFDDTAAKKQLHVSAKVAEEAYRNILDVLDAEEKYTHRWNVQVLRFLELTSSADDNLSLIEDIARKIDFDQLCIALWSECSEIFSRTESWLNKLQHEIVVCMDNRAPCSFSFHHYLNVFPAEKHPKYAHFARLTLDMVNSRSKGKQWNTEYLRLLITSGILKEFMSDGSDYQLLEPGLKGPAWERIEPALPAEFVANNELWLLQNFDELTSLNVSFVRELCSNFSGVLLEYLVSLAINRINHAVDYSLSLLERINNAEKIGLSNFLFRNPNIGRIVFDNWLRVMSVHLSREGHAEVSFDLFTRSLLSTDDRRIPSREVVIKLIAERDQIIVSDTKDDTQLKKSDVKLVHGRTAYLNEQGKAIKLEKKGKSELGDEMRMDLFFQRHHAELQLTSDLPQNPILLKRVKLDGWLAGKLAPKTAEYKLHKVVGFYTGLQFDVPEGYNIHLHRVESMEELLLASAKSLGDAAILAKRFGLVSVAPADLFHNLEDNRRYIWNIDMKPSILGKNGAGRLDQWRKAIRYVNMGQSGIRDLKHFKFIDEIEMGETSFDRVITILTNIGDFLLSWMLSVGEWFMTRGFDQTELLSVLTHGLSTFMSKFTDRPMKECTEFVTGALRLDRLALQMKYYMSKEYVDDINNNRKIPSDIYGKGVQVEAEKPEEYWNEKEGWMRHEGEEDLGPYNGPYPITEMIRTLHIVLTITLNLE